jgi:hypothetical protein
MVEPPKWVGWVHTHVSCQPITLLFSTIEDLNDILVFFLDVGLILDQEDSGNYLRWTENLSILFLFFQFILC